MEKGFARLTGYGANYVHRYNAKGDDLSILYMSEWMLAGRIVKLKRVK